MSHIKRQNKHLVLVMDTSFSSLGLIDGQYRIGLVVSYGTEPVKVYYGDTEAMAKAAAEEGLDKLTTKMGGGQVIISIDEI
jgi:hypothetical protein